MWEGGSVCFEGLKRVSFVFFPQITGDFNISDGIFA